jgi:hypothetical protein
MPQSAAAVIDLEDFRRLREDRRPAQGASSSHPVPRPVPTPVWVVWVPVWFVA